MIRVNRSALAHLPQAACQHIGTVFCLRIADALADIKAPAAFLNSCMVIIRNNNIRMDIILLELLHNAFHTLLRLRMAAKQTVVGAAALLRQIIKLPHRNQHAIRIKARSDRVLYALLIRSALVGTTIAGKKRLLRCLHKAHALSLRRYNKYQRGPHLLFNRVHRMLFRYVTNLMT